MGGGEGLGEDMACFSVAVRMAGLSLATWVFNEDAGALGAESCVCVLKLLV